jgi:hypothetical protein
VVVVLDQLLIRSIPESLTYSVPLFLQRRCDRTLGWWCHHAGLFAAWRLARARPVSWDAGCMCWAHSHVDSYMIWLYFYVCRTRSVTLYSSYCWTRSCARARQRAAAPSLCRRRRRRAAAAAIRACRSTAGYSNLRRKIYTTCTQPPVYTM